MTLRWLKKLVLIQVAILALGLHASAETLCCASFYQQTAFGKTAGLLCLDGSEEQTDAASAFVSWARENGVLEELAEVDVLPAEGTDLPHACDCHDNHSGSGATLVGGSDFIRLLATLPERQRAPEGEHFQSQCVHDAHHARAPPAHSI